MTVKIAIILINLIFGNQPYSLVVQDEPSSWLVDVCRSDDNCMDIMSIDEATEADKQAELIEHDCWDQGTIKGTDLCMMIANPEKGVF